MFFYSLQNLLFGVEPHNEADDFIRLNLQESVVGEQIFVYNHKDICLFRHKKYFERCKR